MDHRSYAHRDVLDKLGIRMGQAVVLASEAREVDAELREYVLSRIGGMLAGEDEAADVVLAVVDGSSNVVEVLQRWRQRLKPTGGIWLMSAKRGLPGYVDQRDLILAGSQAGVVDNKICSISPEVSAMRFVIRKHDRV